MSRRVSEEVRILNWFESAPAERVDLMFNLVKASVKKRMAGQVVAAKPAKKTGRKAKPNGKPSEQAARSASTGTTAKVSTTGPVSAPNSSVTPFGN